MKKVKEYKPRKNQVDFTNVRWAPVVNCVVKYRSQILLVKRNSQMKLYPGYWNGISGFLDDHKNLREKVLQEVKEELGLQEKDISSIRLGQIFDQEEKKYKKTWIVHPVLVTLKSKKDVKLDWEAEEYKWATIEEAKKLDLLPGFDMVLEALFGQISSNIVRLG